MYDTNKWTAVGHDGDALLLADKIELAKGNTNCDGCIYISGKYSPVKPLQTFYKWGMWEDINTKKYTLKLSGV